MTVDLLYNLTALNLCVSATIQSSPRCAKFSPRPLPPPYGRLFEWVKYDVLEIANRIGTCCRWLSRQASDCCEALSLRNVHHTICTPLQYIKSTPNSVLHTTRDVHYLAPHGGSKLACTMHKTIMIIVCTTSEFGQMCIVTINRAEPPVSVPLFIKAQILRAALSLVKVSSCMVTMVKGGADLRCDEFL